MLEKDDRIGDYTLVKFLGRGQFGEVWLAEKQLKMATRKVRHALKFLSNLGEEVNLKAAEAEVDTWIEAGGHPNVMSVIDMLVAGNHIVIVSEFAEGGSLNGWLKKYGGKAPTEAAALEMMLGILRGIEHLHARHVVHRDLKPDNILLQGDFPRITDFGISRIIGDGTMSTKAIGSPAYMSPESFAGSKSPPTDIWSAGVILYEMLTGRFPYEHETVWGLVNAIQTEAARPLPANVSTEARAVVETALRKTVGERFQTAAEMRAAVEGAIYNLKGSTSQKHIATEKIENPPLTIGQMPTITGDENDFEDATPPLPPDEKSEQFPINSLPPLKDSETGDKTFYEAAPVADNVAPSVHLVSETQPAPTVNMPRETQAAPTAVAIKTGDERVAETQDWGEVERRRLEREQAEFVKLSGDIESRAKAGAPSKSPFGLIATVAGGIIVLSLVSVLIWAMSGNSTTVANSNSGQNSAAPADKSVAPEGMAFVPGGEFMMGRDDGKNDVEKPTRKISVQPFYIDVYETTNEQYAEFVKAANRKPPTNWKNDSYPNGQAKYPVVGVNWDDANDYAKWAGKRLPTEEEWEFAARGTESFLYPWGNEWKAGSANVGTQAFAEVGKFKGASPFGVYDLVGNAWEWTSSDFKAYPGGKLPEAFAGKTDLKTIRGGSFEGTKDFATGTYRIGWAATGAVNYDRTGFRCAKDAGK